MILFIFLLNIIFNLTNAFTFHSKFNNWLDITSSLKDKSRSWFINRAEKKGINWNKYKDKYQLYFDELLMIKDLTSNQYMYYPNYYLKPFHGYDKGNLNWEASFEADGATLSMSSNYWKNNNPIECQSWLRGNYSNNIKKYYNEMNKTQNINHILDIGCSVGISTEFLYKNFPKSNLTGIDLSPFFLSIANFRAKKKNLPINYIHGNAESMPIQKEKFDLVCSQFLFHEVPKNASLNILKESYRVMKNDSVIAIIDLDPLNLENNPLFKFIRKYLFELTEPHIKEYYKTNMTELLIEAGFTNISKYSNNDPFNSIWIGTKPDLKLKSYIYSKLSEQDNIIKNENNL